MPTFKKIPEVVDGRQFEGGPKNATDLLLWVHSNEGKALWVEERVTWRSGSRQGTAPEHIRLYDMPFSHIFELVYVGDWIIRRQSGKFEVVRPQELASDYEQV